MELVKTSWQEHGLNRTLETIGLPRSTWYYWKTEKRTYQQKYSQLKSLIEKIIDQYPDYGYRKIKVELEETYGQVVNHKVLLRLLRLWDLRLLRSARNTEKSEVRKSIQEAGSNIDLVKGKEKFELFEVAYTDFTNITYECGVRKAKLIPIIGHRSKAIFGWAVGKHANADLALKSWKRAKRTFKKQEIPFKGMIIHQDQDAVFTGNRWVDKLLREDKVRLSYSENGARGNPMMESFNGHFKCPNHSLFCEAKTIEDLREIVRDRVHYWNSKRRHAGLDYQAPLVYIKQRRADEK